VRWLRRLTLAFVMLSLAALAGWRWAKVRTFPIGAGEWVDAPQGQAYAALYQIHERPFWGRAYSEWRMEVGRGSAVQPTRIIFQKKVKVRDLPDPLTAEHAMRWEKEAVVFHLRTNEVRISISELKVAP